MLILAMLDFTCSSTTFINGSLANSRRFESLREPKIEFQLVFLRQYLISSFSLEILNMAELFRSLLPHGLARSLSVHHLAITCRSSEAEPEPCPPALSIPTPSLAFWSLLALSTAVLAMAAMAGRSSLPLQLLRSSSVSTKRSTTSLSSRRTSTVPRIINSATAVRRRRRGRFGSRRRAWPGHLGPSLAQLSSPTGERGSWDAPRLFPTTAGDLPPPESAAGDLPVQTHVKDRAQQFDIREGSNCEP